MTTVTRPAWSAAAAAAGLMAVAACSADRQPYRANLAAAEAALRLQEAGAAQAWLDDVPAAHRGWAWDVLRAAADRSVRTWGPLPARPTALAAAGDVLAIGLDDGSVAVIAREQPDAAIEWLADGGPAIRTVTLDAGGGLLATGGRDGAVRLWDRDGPRTLWQHDHPIGSVAFTPDGTRLVAASYVASQLGTVAGAARLIDVASGQVVAQLDAGRGPMSGVAVSPDGRTLALASSDGAVYLWQPAEAGAARLASHESHDGGPLSDVAFGPGVVAAVAGRTVLVWDAETAELRLELTGHRGSIRSFAFSPDGAVIAAGGDDGTIRLWNAADGRPQQTLLGHRSGVTAVAFVDVGTLASAGADRTVRLWDVEPRPGSARSSEPAYAAACSPDGRRLATGGDDGVLLWDLDTGLGPVTLIGHNEAVVAAAFSPDGRLLATGSRDLTVRLWDVATETETAMLFPRTPSVAAVAFAADGRVVLSAGAGDLRAFEVAGGARLDPGRPRADGVCTDAHGQAVAWSTTGGLTELFDAVTGDGLVTLAVTPWCVAFDPRGRLVATGTDQGRVTLWDLRRGSLVGELHGHEMAVSAVAFSPDGRLATASTDGTVRLWDVDARGEIIAFGGHHQWIHDILFVGDRLILCGAGGVTVLAPPEPRPPRNPRK